MTTPDAYHVAAMNFSFNGERAEMASNVFQAPRWIDRYRARRLVSARREQSDIGRIYKVTGGPQSAQWFWAVQVGPDGERRNGGAGYFPTGKEAREICETLTAGIMAKLPHRV